MRVFNISSVLSDKVVARHVHFISEYCFSSNITYDVKRRSYSSAIVNISVTSNRTMSVVSILRLTLVKKELTFSITTISTCSTNLF